jgi:hypothetical protein
MFILKWFCSWTSYQVSNKLMFKQKHGQNWKNWTFASFLLVYLYKNFNVCNFSKYSNFTLRICKLSFALSCFQRDLLIITIAREVIRVTGTWWKTVNNFLATEPGVQSDWNSLSGHKKSICWTCVQRVKIRQKLI